MTLRICIQLLKATEWFWIRHGWTLLSSYKQEIDSWNLLYEDLSIKYWNKVS